MIIKFYLASGSKEATIRACFYEDKIHQFKLHTRFKIAQKYWDKKNQKSKKGMHGFESFNDELELYRLEILKQIRLMGFDKIKEWERFRSNIKQILSTGKYQKTKSIILKTAIDQFITERANEYKSGTVRKYRILKTLIIHFEKKYKISRSTENLDYSEFKLPRRSNLLPDPPERMLHTAAKVAMQFCHQICCSDGRFHPGFPYLFKSLRQLKIYPSFISFAACSAVGLRLLWFLFLTLSIDQKHIPASCINTYPPIGLHPLFG